MLRWHFFLSAFLPHWTNGAAVDGIWQSATVLTATEYRTRTTSTRIRLYTNAAYVALHGCEFCNLVRIRCERHFLCSSSRTLQCTLKWYMFCFMFVATRRNVAHSHYVSYIWEKSNLCAILHLLKADICRNSFVHTTFETIICVCRDGCVCAITRTNSNISRGLDVQHDVKRRSFASNFIFLSFFHFAKMILHLSGFRLRLTADSFVVLYFVRCCCVGGRSRHEIVECIVSPSCCIPFRHRHIKPKWPKGEKIDSNTIASHIINTLFQFQFRRQSIQNCPSVQHTAPDRASSECICHFPFNFMSVENARRATPPHTRMRNVSAMNVVR